MSNDHLPPIIAAALAPFMPADNDVVAIGIDGGGKDGQLAVSVRAVKPSLVVDCPACYGGWRDTPTGTVMCGQCGGTGRVATNQGEP